MKKAFLRWFMPKKGFLHYGGAEALKVERFGENSPMDCFWRISRPEHRDRLKSDPGA